jgi:glycerol uptake facilitator protein
MKAPNGDYYFRVPLIGPFIGGAIGAYIYDWFVGNFLPLGGEVGEVVEADKRPEATP